MKSFAKKDSLLKNREESLKRNLRKRKKIKQIKQTPIISSTYNILYKEKEPKAQLKKLEKLIS